MNQEKRIKLLTALPIMCTYGVQNSERDGAFISPSSLFADIIILIIYEYRIGVARINIVNKVNVEKWPNLRSKKKKRTQTSHCSIHKYKCVCGNNANMKSTSHFH